jgi:hypothetical protein
MENEPTCWFALAAEDAPHHAAVTRLTDRVLEEAIEWFSPETRDELRQWRDATPLRPYWKVTSAVKEAHKLGLPLRGHFGDRPAELESVMYRAQLLVWQHIHVHGQRIDVAFIARDTDHKPRKRGAEQALASGRWPFRVVLAFPHPEIEVWAIATFQPTDQAARDRVAKLTLDLGYSPVEHPERLTSTVSGGLKDAKKIRDELFEGRADQGEGWLETELGFLRERGKNCGLADFLRDVETTVVSLLGGDKPGGR